VIKDFQEYQDRKAKEAKRERVVVMVKMAVMEFLEEMAAVASEARLEHPDETARMVNEALADMMVMFHTLLMDTMSAPDDIS
jgi:hypothetical protein